MLWPLRHAAETKAKCSFHARAKERQETQGNGCDFERHSASWQQSLGSSPGLVTPSVVLSPARPAGGAWGGQLKGRWGFKAYNGGGGDALDFLLGFTSQLGHLSIGGLEQVTVPLSAPVEEGVTIAPVTMGTRGGNT